MVARAGLAQLLVLPWAWDLGLQTGGRGELGGKRTKLVRGYGMNGEKRIHD
jgi:hypothetical protein